MEGGIAANVPSHIYMDPDKIGSMLNLGHHAGFPVGLRQKRASMESIGMYSHEFEGIRGPPSSAHFNLVPLIRVEASKVRSK